jgi:tetratricopeptide (TPR) repeat protein
MRYTVIKAAFLLGCVCLESQVSAAPAGDGPMAGPGPDSMNSSSVIQADGLRSVSISGKLMLDDGTAPSDIVLVERICEGRIVQETYSNSRGHFNFLLAQPSSMVESTESLGHTGVRDNGMSCEVRAVMPGFRSDAVSLFKARYMDAPDIGTIVLHRIANVDGLTFSATSGLAPKDARKAYEKGLEAAQKNKPDEARSDFDKAVHIYPRYASAWFELGKVYEQSDHPGEARDAYSQAVAADPKFIRPYERLYLLAAKDANWQEVAQETDHVMRLDPFDFPNAYYFSAAANLQLDKLDVAEKNARRALELDTAQRMPKTHYILGMIFAKKRDFTRAAEFLRTYLKVAPNDPNAGRIREQLGLIENLAQGKGLMEKK